MLNSCFLYSQNIEIKGKIVDESTNSPLEAATVYFVKVSDSTVVDYSISDNNGNFKFNLKAITYPVVLKISFVGYSDYKNRINSFEESRDFGIIKMKENVNQLDGLTLNSEIPPIIIKKDTVEFNASSFKVRPDANVESLLKQLPGVEIASDGKITVNGKEVNQILVNGKPFFDKDGKIALQSLPSNIINKVQITDTKTVKEEKTGTAASSDNSSINLTIDEDKNKGLFGKVMGGYGSDNRYESSGLLNYFKNKTKISVLASSNNINSIGFSMDEIFDNMGGGRNSNIYYTYDGAFSINGRTFGGNKGITQSNLVGLNYSDEWTKNTEVAASYFYSENNSKNTNRINRRIFLPTGDFTTNSITTSKTDKTVHNFTTDFEYKIDSLTSITIRPQFTAAINKNKIVNSENSLDATGNLLNESSSDTFFDDLSNGFKNTLTFTKNFKKKGRYLSLEIANDNSKAENETFLKSATVFYQQANPDDIRDQFNRSVGIKNNYTGEIQYASPITDSITLKFTTNVLLNANSDKTNAFDYNGGTNTYADRNSLLSNFYEANEKTIQPSTGLSISKKKINFNVDFGASFIDYSANATYLSADTQYQRNYVLPYISTSANIKFTKSKSIYLGYDYDYNLPSANEILPVLDLSNPLNTKIGNDKLDLNKSHRLFLSYRNYDFATRSGYGIYGGGNYNDSQVVSSITYDVNRKKTSSFDNVDGTYNGWFGLYWNKSFKKEAHKFRMDYRLNNDFGSFKGFTESVLFNANSYTFAPRASFSYDYGELLTISPSYNYTWNKINYSNYFIDKASNFSHKFNIQVTNYWPKNWTFGNDFGYNYNSNIGAGFKKDFYLWNTSIAYSFMDKRWMAKVKVYDLLNQNVSATRRISATSITDAENVVLRRYVMFSLTYKLEKFGAKEKKSNRFMH